jgi:hypothetical protein
MKVEKASKTSCEKADPSSLPSATSRMHFRASPDISSLLDQPELTGSETAYAASRKAKAASSLPYQHGPELTCSLFHHITRPDKLGEETIDT